MGLGAGAGVGNVRGNYAPVMAEQTAFEKTYSPENLRRWIRRPDEFKRGSLMPAMGLTEAQLDAITSYLTSLR